METIPQPERHTHVRPPSRERVRSGMGVSSQPVQGAERGPGFHSGSYRPRHHAVRKARRIGREFSERSPHDGGIKRAQELLACRVRANHCVRNRGRPCTFIPQAPSVGPEHQPHPGKGRPGSREAPQPAGVAPPRPPGAIPITRCVARSASPAGLPQSLKKVTGPRSRTHAANRARSRPFAMSRMYVIRGSPGSGWLGFGVPSPCLQAVESPRQISSHSYGAVRVSHLVQSTRAGDEAGFGSRRSTCTATGSRPRGTRSPYVPGPRPARVRNRGQ
jgi:hypothetical protein